MSCREAAVPWQSHYPDIISAAEENQKKIAEQSQKTIEITKSLK
jgi:hypothetical protein